MSSVNKQSLREEFDTLKSQFKHLCAEGKMGSDSRALFQAMLMLFELLMAVFMERNTAKNSKTSSRCWYRRQSVRSAACIRAMV